MLDRAYDMGRQAAIAELEKLASDPMEKEAFLGALKNIYQGSKLLRTGGWLLGMGGRSSQWIGMPLGSGLIGAATADKGEGFKGFATGVAGGLVGAGAGALGGKLFTGIGNRAGKYLKNTNFGKKVWSGAGKINPNYGANSLAKYEAELAAAKAHNAANPTKLMELPIKPTVNTQYSFGQHALSKAPAALGIGGTIGGFMYGTSAGEEMGSAAWDAYRPNVPRLGSFGKSNVFNPAGY